MVCCAAINNKDSWPGYFEKKRKHKLGLISRQEHRYTNMSSFTGVSEMQASPSHFYYSAKGDKKVLLEYKGSGGIKITFVPCYSKK